MVSLLFPAWLQHPEAGWDEGSDHELWGGLWFPGLLQLVATFLGQATSPLCASASSFVKRDAKNNPVVK